MKNWLDRFFILIPDRASGPLLRPLRQGIYGLYTLTVLAVVVMLAGTSWNDYQRSVQEVRNQTLSLARLLDEHLTRSLVSVEQAMQNTGEDIARAGGLDQLDERRTHEQLKAKIELTPQIRGIIAMDSKGILRAHGLEYPTRHVDLSDRDYFGFHRQQPDKRFRIGIPVVSRTDYKWLIPITKRLDRPDGSFDGLMLSGVEPNYFLRFYDSLQLAAGTRIQVLLNDGNILLTYPLDTSSIGRSLRETDPRAFNEISLSQTTFIETRNRQEQKIYLTQLANQGNLPLTIRIITDKNKALEKHGQETITRTSSAIALLLVVSIMLWLLIRQIRRVEASESRLHLTQFTVDESPDMILWCDHTGLVRYANRRLVDTSGYSSREIRLMKYADLLADGGKLLNNLQTYMQTLHYPETSEQRMMSRLPALPQQQKMETSLLTRNKQQIPVEITLSLIEFNAEAYLCINARDITERHEAERELRHHRDHLQDLVAERTSEIRTVLDASPLAVVLSLQHHIRLVNPAFESLFGYSTNEIIDQPESILHESVHSHHTAAGQITTRTRSGGTFRGEMELRRKDGSAFWSMLFAKALAPEAPERGMILIIEDITAQRIAAQAVRQSERLRRSIINTTSDGFALIDKERRFVDVNTAFCDILGLSRKKLIGHQCESLLGELAHQLFPLDAGSGSKYVEEVFLPCDDQPDHPFLVNGGVIADENGESEYAFAFLTDISRQKEVERTLLEAKETAEAANNAKTVFLANMSHELRTPMHAILSFSEIGLQKAGDGEAGQLARYFERINTSGKRLLALLNDLLDMSRLEANKMSYDMARHILQATSRSAVNEISSLLASKQLSLSFDESTPKLLSIYDKARITQVMVNLLSNAIKFSPQGGQIDIRFISDGILENGQPAIGLTVHDHGPGIPPQDLERIFDTFAQSKQVQNQGGTGLGLAISRRIMLDHNGCIFARNHANGGAIFTILLPKETGEDETGALPDKSEP